ncbi:putative cystathionine beta-synthase [Gregarina niphandrodes]|uniref:cystathionine beta-synthase n=1 Tax=Gregarina niphandrodes TaxID=110365 RepID=A0A023B7J8_GRENI|nr:putative cystathionine beta-synthase [Gregarina niphandrodes]EZG67412.1 putative cystathionine beta-synthase [Gregarina niphandrodes]|eukprot:XP_011130245.1 putative cystathionine beta-synthase [Gregarina niphandrodes]
MVSITTSSTAYNPAAEKALRECVSDALKARYVPTYDAAKIDNTSVDNTGSGGNTSSVENASVPDYNGVRTELTEPVTYPERTPKAVIDKVYESVGHTPMIRLHNIELANNLECELYGKLEFMNAGGSIKDRIARRMIERTGDTLRRGDFIVEATSGNTGIGLGMVCAAEGYRLVVVMPEKMSREKENTLTALGAIVIRTRNSAAWNDEDSHIAIAYKLRDLINERSEQLGGARAYCLDQYQAVGNIEAHYAETAEEIVEQMQGRVDYFIAGCGTGGTFTGTSKKLKEKIPHIKCVQADPAGSVMHKPLEEIKGKKCSRSYEVEGIGYDFHPPCFDQKIVDAYEIVDDKDAFKRARELIKIEGVLCGGSAGSALEAAIRTARRATPGSRIVFIIPDSVRNYISKFIADDWMLVHHIFNDPEEHKDYVLGEGDSRYNTELTTFPTFKLPKVDGKETVVDVYSKYFYGSHTLPSRCSHVAVVEGKELKGIVSYGQLEELILQQKNDNKAIINYALPYSITFVNKTVTNENINEIRTHLLSQEFEPKLKSPLVIVTDEPRRENECLSDYKSRILAHYQWDQSEVNGMTPSLFMSALRKFDTPKENHQKA